METEIKLPRWRWGKLSVYNGFSHEERVRGWQWQIWAKKSGLIGEEKFCNISGRRLDKLDMHLENYYTPWDIFFIDPELHMKLHRRFMHKAIWLDIVDRYRSSRAGVTYWFESLNTQDMPDIAYMLRLEHDVEASDIWGSELFMERYPNLEI